MNHNLLDPHLSGWLEHVLRTRGADVFLSSPPCRTTSLCKILVPNLGGVHGDERFGLSTLSAFLQRKTDLDSILWLESLYWIWLGFQTNPMMKCLVESPQDPNQWCKSLDTEVPSFWKWPETLHMARLFEFVIGEFAAGGSGTSNSEAHNFDKYRRSQTTSWFGTP